MKSKAILVLPALLLFIFVMPLQLIEARPDPRGRDKVICRDCPEKMPPTPKPTQTPLITATPTKVPTQKPITFIRPTVAPTNIPLPTPNALLILGESLSLDPIEIPSSPLNLLRLFLFWLFGIK